MWHIDTGLPSLISCLNSVSGTENLSSSTASWPESMCLHIFNINPFSLDSVDEQLDTDGVEEPDAEVGLWVKQPSFTLPTLSRSPKGCITS